MKRTIYKFRLERGVHIYRDVYGNEKKAKRKDIIETDQDLAARYNIPGVAPRVTNLGESTIDIDVASPSNTSSRIEDDVNVETSTEQEETNDPLLVELQSMTVNQLREMAEDDEIDLGTAARKDEIVKAIYAAHK
jgi:hypothetical protein